jgi:hypothetical protein
VVQRYPRRMSPDRTASITSARWVFGVLITAGGVGVVLRLAGIHSPLCSALVLLFVAVAPTVAIYGLLGSFDPYARLILACTTNVVFLTLTASLMLAEDVWSPLGGLVAVAVITMVALVAQWPPVRRLLTRAAASWRKTGSNGGALARATDRETAQDG